MTKHIDSFRETFENGNYHIIANTESWLNDHIYDSAVSLHNYFLLRHDRTHSGRGGGVCLYIHNSLKAKVLHTSNNVQYHPEFMLTEIRPTPTSTLLFSIVYRPPGVCFLNDFFDVLSVHSHRYSDVIIVGDFNTDMSRQNRESRFLNNHIISQSLYLVPSEPTHHSVTTHTLLDLVIVDDLIKILSFEQSGTPFLSGHELLTFNFAHYCDPVSQFSFTYRDFSKFNTADFLNTLTPLVYNDHYADGNFDLRLENLNQSLLQAYNILAPLRTYTSKRPPAPWMTPDIRSEIRLRERLRARFRRSGNAAC